MQIGEVPDPFGPIAEDDFLACAAPAAMPGFCIQSLSELLGRLDGTCVGGRVRVANRKALLVPAGLCKDASQFDFPGMSGLTVDFARPSLGLGAHHGYASAIEFDIEHGNGGAMGIGRSHCRARLRFLLLACSNVSANRLRRAFDRFSGHSQASQQFHLLAPWSNGASEPTTDNMRRTPGDISWCSISSWASRGNCPR